MKKDLKKYLIGVLIGTIIFGGIGVYATAQILSKDISYTKTDGTTTSVENALNELYENSELQYDYYYAQSIETASSSQTITFTKDYKYIFIFYGSSNSGNLGDISLTTNLEVINLKTVSSTKWSKIKYSLAYATNVKANSTIKFQAGYNFSGPLVYAVGIY